MVDLTRDMIAAAQRWIYIENQYLTSAAVGSALARSPGQENGPEVVIVLPREEHGWLEQSSMGILRARLLRRLAQSDRYGRLRLYYPTVPELDAGCMNVHSKVMIVDGVVARVGSANLSNRSMGLDTECDLALDAALDPRLGPVVEQFRDRLLAEHLGVDRAGLRRRAGRPRLADRGRRGAARGAAHAGHAARPGRPGRGGGGGRRPSLHLAFLDGLVCDPERPAADLLVETFVPTGLRTPVHRSLRGWVALVLALLVLAAVWRFTPLRGLLHIERITALLRRLAEQPATPAWVLGGYLVGGLIFFPITLLLGATALVFRPLPAIAYCLTGTLASAAVTYWIGRLMGHVRAGWLHGPRLTRFEKQLRHRGMLAIVAARLLPVGNFSLINMAAGAFGIGFRDYMLGNAIGVLPGILALTLFADRLGSTLRHPRGANLVMLAAVALALVAVLSWIRRRLADTLMNRLAESASLRVVQHPPVRRDGRRRDPERVAAVLREIDADVIGLQEVDARPGATSDSMQMQYLASALGLHAVAGPTIVRHDGHYGNALLTRRPVLDVRRVDLTVYRREPRAAIDADLDIDGAVVRVIVTHLGLLPGERRIQVRRLLDSWAPQQRGDRAVRRHQRVVRGRAAAALAQRAPGSRRRGAHLPDVLPGVRAGSVVGQPARGSAELCARTSRRCRASRPTTCRWSRTSSCPERSSGAAVHELDRFGCSFREAGLASMRGHPQAFLARLGRGRAVRRNDQGPADAVLGDHRHRRRLAPAGLRRAGAEDRRAGLGAGAAAPSVPIGPFGWSGSGWRSRSRRCRGGGGAETRPTDTPHRRRTSTGWRARGGGSPTSTSPSRSARPRGRPC